MTHIIIPLVLMNVCAALIGYCVRGIQTLNRMKKCSNKTGELIDRFRDIKDPDELQRAQSVVEGRMSVIGELLGLEH